VHLPTWRGGDLGFGVSVIRVSGFLSVCLLLPVHLTYRPFGMPRCSFRQDRRPKTIWMKDASLAICRSYGESRSRAPRKSPASLTGGKKSSCETVTRAAVGHTIGSPNLSINSPDLLSMQDNFQNRVLIWKKPLALSTRNGPRNDPPKAATTERVSNPS
jgi:hypothetical protein